MESTPPGADAALAKHTPDSPGLQQKLRSEVPPSHPFLSPKAVGAFQRLKLSMEKGADNFAALCSLTQVGTRAQLDDLRILIHEGAVELEYKADPEIKREAGAEDKPRLSVLGELVAYLASPARPNLERFKEATAGEAPTDRERLSLLQGLNPLKGKCQNGDPPLIFAYRHRKTELFDILIENSLDPHMPALLEEYLYAFADAELRAAVSARNIKGRLPEAMWPVSAPAVAGFEERTSGPYACSGDYREGVDHLDRGELGEAVQPLAQAARGANGEDWSPADNLCTRLASYHNLILIHKDKRLKLGHDQKQEALMGFIREAYELVSSLGPSESLPDKKRTRVFIATVYGAIMEQWHHFSDEEKRVFLSEILDQISHNPVFLDEIATAFHHAIFQPLVLEGTDPALESRVVEALKHAEELASVSVTIAADGSDDAGNADDFNDDGSVYVPSEYGGSEYGDDEDVMSAYRVPGQFLRKIEAEKWKINQDDIKLRALLDSTSMPAMSEMQKLMEYFDLFVHAESTEARNEIALAFGERAGAIWKVLDHEGGRGPKSEYYTAGGFGLYHLAFAGMGLHLLRLNDKENAGSRASDSGLEVMRCALYAQDAVSPEASQTVESDRRLRADIAFEGNALVETLKELRDRGEASPSDRPGGPERGGVKLSFTLEHLQ